MNILSSYNGDIKNVVIPEGIRMIRGEEIAFGTEFEMEDRRLWEKRVKAPFSRDKRIESVSMGDSVVVIGPKAMISMISCLCNKSMKKFVFKKKLNIFLIIT